MKKGILLACLTGLLAANTAFAMTVTSKNITEGESLHSAQVFDSWGCSGKNMSPELTWKDAPAGTKSFAVTMYDPDAPTGSGWWHWSVVNIPANVHSLPENAGAKNSKLLPKGAEQLTNDFGYKGFGGACPPAGANPHNYQITVYALKTKLDLPENASPALAGYYILSNRIGEAQLIAPTNTRK